PYHFSLSSITLPPPPLPTLFPYTTLFRSTPPSSSHPYLPLYRRRPVISLIVERVISRSNARLISVAVNPDCSRVMIMARCRLLTDRKSTRLNSSHVKISYAVFCLKKKKQN